MGKNKQADECKVCGNLIYYGGANPCCSDKAYDVLAFEKGYEEYLGEIELGIMKDTSREDAIKYVEEAWDKILSEDEGEDNIHKMSLHDAIWYASTEILPSLEVQAVIDSKNQIFVSTGTAGYVDYLTIDPSTLIGMKLPIKCWIHTHPFGSAYFSGTDWRTISIWKENMNCAYVLGSEMSSVGHYGFWTTYKKNELEIYNNGEPQRTQEVKFRGEEE